jgi:hypothetical protein
MKWLIISLYLLFVMNSIIQIKAIFQTKQNVVNSSMDKINPPIETLKKDSLDNKDSNPSLRGSCSILNVTRKQRNGKTVLKFKYRIFDNEEHDFFAIQNNDKEYFNIDNNTFDKINENEDNGSNSKYLILSSKANFRKDSAMKCRISYDLEQLDFINNKDFDELPAGISFRTL